MDTPVAVPVAVAVRAKFPWLFALISLPDTLSGLSISLNISSSQPSLVVVVVEEA